LASSFSYQSEPCIQRKCLGCLHAKSRACPL
jgi:hypothetical protein